MYFVVSIVISMWSRSVYFSFSTVGTEQSRGTTEITGYAFILYMITGFITFFKSYDFIFLTQWWGWTPPPPPPPSPSRRCRDIQWFMFWLLTASCSLLLNKQTLIRSHRKRHQTVLRMSAMSLMDLLPLFHGAPLCDGSTTDLFFELVFGYQVLLMRPELNFLECILNMHKNPTC